MSGSAIAHSSRIADADYERLLEFRTGLRRFLRWSEEQAQAAGVSPAQHQLLLAIRGHPDARGPTIGDVAEYLLLRHHSAVELIDRAVTAGLVRRRQDRDDHRVVRLQLTARGAEKLRRLTAVTLEELARLSPRLRPVWSGLEAN
jgi:DNA-binding MarR family transcriptional regulator